ncbi:hypothetical protein PR048_026212 [Dryococelus australis]|uniref:Retrotransposon gag domain-containing protein n=1 Tax=Dryococelus australis TaxID=614101 RepID=A0ABQ9GKQ1_9NEOP|nr:hypothetical protein PR048_026212 [Dryococelus australis]
MWVSCQTIPLVSWFILGSPGFSARSFRGYSIFTLFHRHLLLRPGTPTDDLVAFLEDCISRLTRYGVSRDKWASCVGAQLHGDAHPWWTSLNHYVLQYEEFRHAFQCRFRGVFASVQAQSKLTLEG